MGSTKHNLLTIRVSFIILIILILNFYRCWFLIVKHAAILSIVPHRIEEFGACTIIED